MARRVDDHDDLEAMFQTRSQAQIERRSRETKSGHLVGKPLAHRVDDHDDLNAKFQARSQGQTSRHEHLNANHHKSTIVASILEKEKCLTIESEEIVHLTNNDNEIYNLASQILDNDATEREEQGEEIDIECNLFT